VVVDSEVRPRFQEIMSEINNNNNNNNKIFYQITYMPSAPGNVDCWENYNDMNSIPGYAPV